MLFSFNLYAIDVNKQLDLSCKDYSWGDVEILVQPYLDDALYTSLVMQGQSAGYKTSEAARQALDDSLPDVIRRTLNALIKADC